MQISLVLFLALFIFLFILPEKYKKFLSFSLIFAAFIILLILFPEKSLKAGQYGFNLWLNIVFPSLFPFFVASELLRNTGLIRALGVIFEPIMRPVFNVPGIGSFAFAMGITSGYPVGAKITVNLREEKLCTKTEAERLLAFTNNSSPLFITGAVAAGILKKPELGIVLLVTHFLACITVGVLFRFYRCSEKKIYRNNNNKNMLERIKEEIINSPEISLSNIGLRLGEAIKNSIETLLMVGGFIVLFAVIINILIGIKVVALISVGIKFIYHFIGLSNSLAFPVSAGIFEITSGINYITLSHAPLVQKMTIVSLILGWGGLSVHAQVASIVSKSDISIKPYILGKFLQGLFSAIYIALFFNAIGIYDNSVPTFGNLPTDYLSFQAVPVSIAETITLFIGIGLLLLLVEKVIKRELSNIKTPLRQKRDIY